MNRRQFFGMTAAAVAAAGLSPLVLPERTIFLPPRSGWPHEPWYIREIRQYTINDDQIPTRFDALYEDIWGSERQYRVDFPQVTALDALHDPSIFDRQRKSALAQMEAIRLEHRLLKSSKQLSLPNGVAYARIWTVP